MPQPRKNIVALEETPYYHCIGRCVRRAFLCGKDEFSGKNYEHRRQWVVDRLNLLSSTFAIELCSYAVMSNHYHLVIRISPNQCKRWTQSEVIQRWQKLYSGGTIVRMFQDGITLSESQKFILDSRTEIWRERLGNISWYMRCLNEHLARMANKEDNCTGRFWEGRFKSQALLDEAALITCMAYVDLNPIKAGMAKTTASSDYTSVKERIKERLGKPHQAKYLLKMVGVNNQEDGLPITLIDYLNLLEWSTLSLSPNKTERIPNQIDTTMHKLNIKPEIWKQQLNHFGKRWYRVVGSKDKIKALATKIGLPWMNGQGKKSPFQNMTI